MTADAPPIARSGGRRRLLYLLPVVAFVAVGIALGLGLRRDPAILPSVLLGKPVPVFVLPGLNGQADDGFANTDLTPGTVRLVNVFASWCAPCRIEHPVLARLAKDGIEIDAINYKDKPADATLWLQEMGNPFRRIGSDVKGRVAIDWGVYGVPETFVIDKEGRIAYKFVGPLQARDVEKTLKPLLAELNK